jgi:dihydropteroate synthase
LSDNSPQKRVWITSRFDIDLSTPQIMGIVNLTPDSFSDGGKANATASLNHAEQLLNDGAHILDLGAESTRPGATPVPLDEELTRLMPVLRGAVKLGVPISVDTYKPQVMQAALDAGADIINDIWALRQPGALDVIAAHPLCGVVLMHMHGEPQTMQVLPMAGSATPQVLLFLKQRTMEIPWEAGNIASKNPFSTRICLDCGIGFGKTVAQNFELLHTQAEILSLGYPLLAGWSRKSSLGAVTGLEVQDRLIPSVAAALLAVERGASIVRVHDVRETAQALRVWAASKP